MSFYTIHKHNIVDTYVWVPMYVLTYKYTKKCILGLDGK